MKPGKQINPAEPTALAAGLATEKRENLNGPRQAPTAQLSGILAVLVSVFIASSVFAQDSRVTSNPAIGSAGSYSYEGFTEPKHDIMVAADELGRIDSIDVRIGQAVEAGQVIGQLEDDLQQVSVELAKAQLAMTGEMNATKAEMELSESRAIQIRQLASENMVRPDELVRAETDLKIATARHHAVLEQHELRKLELQRYQLQLERRQIRAPLDGVIAEVFHHPGEYITPADPSIVRLMVIDKLFAKFFVPVEEIAGIGEGTVVRLFFRSRSMSVEAPVTSIAPNVHGESGTVQVRVELDNSDRKLLAGDHCGVQIMYGKTMQPIEPSTARKSISVEKTTTR